MAEQTSHETSIQCVPRLELDDRIARLQARLVAADDAEAVFIFQAADLFYFSGTVQNAWLIIGRSGPPLMLVRRSLQRARTESALEHILPMENPREVPKLLWSYGLGGLKRVGIEFDVVPVEQYVRLGRL
ncbi:MAG TPA: aminopeptidase P family N-terminal domain-containing protein, partial [Candidatus Acidoferrum sp.]|nr:aminopeptidase P family N-terminal domain-containing protein [Candidatus Acidoferrum sp.]